MMEQGFIILFEFKNKKVCLEKRKRVLDGIFETFE